MGEILRSARKGRVTIATGAATSSAFQTLGMAMFTAFFPAEFEGTAVTFEVSPVFTGDNANYLTLKDGAGSDVIKTIAASQALALPDELAAVGGFKIVSDANQTTTETVIEIVARA